MQTMLHLAPRLRDAQEQRIAAGVDGPDLTRITRFAALLPADQLNQQGELDLSLFTLPDPEDAPRLPPFYLERLLNDLERDPPRPDTDHEPPTAGPQSAAQRRASLLLAAARDALRPLPWRGGAPRRGDSASAAPAEAPSDPLPAGPRDPGAGSRGFRWPFRRSNNDADRVETRRAAQAVPPPAPPARSHAFRAALHAGDSMAHLVAANLIDPIRADTHSPGDPFVQTTLYVIAPLYEPLTSALIWPTLAHQLNYLGQRHIAQVVGIFAAGSYATDSSRIIEDASCYAALAELEALTGLRPANLTRFVSSLRQEARKQGDTDLPVPEEWLGRPLFDRIYLVDREKSNQGLARNSYELSALVANALQSLIAADGAAYIDEQVGIDLRNPGQRPYSLLGAAADYAPLDYIFRAAQEHEGKRLVRERILRPPGRADTPPEPTAELGRGQPDNSVEPLASLQELGATSQQVLTRLVERLPDLFDELNPQSIQQLLIHPEYVLPTATARALRGLAPVRWQAAFDRRFQSALDQFEESVGVGALDTAWGLAALREDGLPRDPSDPRFLPTVSRQMRASLFALLSAQPSGLMQARRQLRRWLFELERERQALAYVDAAEGAANGPPAAAGRVERQLALRAWRARYRRTLADQPSLFGSLIRAFGLLSGILLLTLVYLFGAGLLDRAGVLINTEANPALLMQLMSRTFLDALRAFLSNEANVATSIGLMIGAFLGATTSFRTRARRAQALRRERVKLACAELTAHLQASVQRGLDRVYNRLEQLLKQMERALEETCEMLQDWSVSEEMPPLPPADLIASHLYRPHLNPTLWERCQAFLRGRQDPEGRGGAGRLEAIWTAPQRRARLASLLTGAQRPARPLAETLSAYVRQCARDAVAGMRDDETEAARLEFVRTLAQECNLEHLLWRDAPASEGFASLYPDGEFTSVPAATLRYLETMWSAAKPSANYDVSDRLAAYGLPVEFAAVSGAADSDLTEGVMQSLRIPRLLTGNAFQIAFVRTLHGLELNDLGSMSRYMAELGRMNYTARQQVLLTEAAYAELYNPVVRGP